MAHKSIVKNHKNKTLKPKLLVCSSFYFPEKGAAPHRITAMAEMLEFDVTVITPLPNYPTGKIFKGTFGEIFSEKMINGVNVVRYWVLPTNSNSRIIRMLSFVVSAISAFVALFRHLLYESNYQVVIIQSPPLPLAFVYQAVSKIFRLRTIINFSDIWPSTAVDLGAMKHGSNSWKVFSFMEKYLHKNADAFIVQSIESKKYLEGLSIKPIQLYRNLTDKVEGLRQPNFKETPIKIIYAGLLGNAQDLLSVVAGINWVSINAEIHIYGDGNQKSAIKSLNTKNVFLHKTVSKDQIQKVSRKYDFSLVTLRVPIFGAFPSKITAAVASNLPILFLGSGEGQKVVDSLGLGKALPFGEFGKVSEFLINYSRDRVTLAKEFRKNLESASHNQFCVKKNNLDLNVFIKKLLKTEKL